MTQSMDLYATASFNLEGLVKKELLRLGFSGAKAEPGGVRFAGTLADAFRACLWLACADRVQIILAEGECRTFEELFQLTKSAPWQALIPPDGRILVSAHCARSRLMSPSDCQKIVKKAIVDKLMAAHRVRMLPETGPVFRVTAALHADRARLTVDACGEALNKRGYRTWNGEAPLRETLAAALCRLIPWRGELPLHDPFCGTGTLLIEAAFMMSRRAPGLLRSFDIEAWPAMDGAAAKGERARALAAFDPKKITGITGTDIDPEALELCRRHIRQAGLEGQIKVWQADFRDLTIPGPAAFLCNPPYGERLGTKKEAEKLYAAFPAFMERHPGSTLSVICAEPGLEKLTRMRAVKKTRLYNGRLECELMTFRPNTIKIQNSPKK